MVDRLRSAAKIQPIIEVKRIGVVPIVTSCTDFDMNPEARIIMAIDCDDDEDGYSEKSPRIAGSGSDLTSLWRTATE
jgi:hypothetical protein